jgi:hypothetical protein
MIANLIYLESIQSGEKKGFKKLNCSVRLQISAADQIFMSAKYKKFMGGYMIFSYMKVNKKQFSQKHTKNRTPKSQS